MIGGLGFQGLGLKGVWLRVFGFRGLGFRGLKVCGVQGLGAQSLSGVPLMMIAGCCNNLVSVATTSTLVLTSSMLYQLLSCLRQTLFHG